MKEYGELFCLRWKPFEFIQFYLVPVGRQRLTLFEARFLCRHSDSFDLDHSRTIIFILVYTIRSSHFPRSLFPHF